MEEKKDNDVKQTVSKDKSKYSIRIIVVLVVLLLFAVYTGVYLRAQYLNIIGINENYIDIFYKKIINKYSILGISFILVYFYFYIINKFIKRGLKKFFD